MTTSYKNTKEMRLRLQRQGEPYLYQKIGRFFSIYFTKVFLKTSITANQISILFCICSIISCYFLYLTIFTQSLLYFFSCVFFLYLFIILDGVDGEIAREKKTASPIVGKVIDVICHEIFDNLVIIAIAIGIYDRSKNYWAFIICLALFFGRNCTRRLEDIIIRTIRLHGKKRGGEKEKNSVSKTKNTQPTKPTISSRIKYLASAVPFKGIHFIGLIAIFGDDRSLLAIFAIWMLAFNIKMVLNATRFFKNPLGYLPD